MVTVTGNNTTQTGRAAARDPALDDVSISYVADFSSAATISFEFATVNQSQQFGVPRTLFVANGTNPNPVVVSVSITQQTFTVPPFAEGYFALNAQDKSVITLTTDGGASQPVTVTVHNNSIPPNVWYAPGSNNPLSATAVQGSMAEGSDITVEASNAPIYIGGIDRATDLLHGISVDATGIVDVEINNADPLSVRQFGPNNAAVASVAASVAVVSVIANNPNRKGAIFFNDSSSNAYLSFDPTGTVTAFWMQPYQSVTLGPGEYTNQVYASWDTATGNMRVTEFD